MYNKLKKYGGYIIGFVKSKRKTKHLKDLVKEILQKGLIIGIQSSLHKKVYDRELQRLKNDTDVDFPAAKHQIYNKATKISLPLTNTPLVSIIVPIGEHDAISGCIHSIYENCGTVNYEVIIAADSSNEHTDVLKANIEHLVIINNKESNGLLRNYNNAAQYAKGGYVVFLQNHLLVQSGWLEELVFVFEHNKYAGLTGSKLLYADGYLQQAGGIVWQDGSKANYGNGENPELPEHNYIKEVDFVSGVVMIKRKLWEKTGGFDEQYTDYEYAAADLCFEVRNNGYKTLYQPFSVAVHSAQEGGTQRTKDIDRERFYSKWRRWLHNKSPIDENVFYERDRTVGERHVVFVDTESPQDSSEWSTTKEVVATLVGLNYSVKLLSGPEQTTMAYRKHFQQNEVEVLYGNDSYLSKQGWRYYFKTHLSALDAVVLDRSSFSNELVSYLRGNRYMGNIIFYDRDLNCLTLEKESAPRKEYTISEALNNADFNKGEKRYSFNKKKMADAFNTIIN